MVSGIDSNYFDLNSIKDSLQQVDTNDGVISAAKKDDLSVDVNYFLDNLGDKVDVDLTLEEVDKMLEAQASKEVAPNMDLDLDISDIPSAPTS